MMSAQNLRKARDIVEDFVKRSEKLILDTPPDQTLAIEMMRDRFSKTREKVFRDWKELGEKNDRRRRSFRRMNHQSPRFN
jgi:hypothetical protein